MSSCSSVGRLPRMSRSSSLPSLSFKSRHRVLADVRRASRCSLLTTASQARQRSTVPTVSLNSSMHGRRCRYHLDRYTSAKVTVLKQRYRAEAAAAALFTPHRDCDRVFSTWIQDPIWYRKDSFRPQIVDVNPHLPAVDEDQSAIRR
jgi:hypothetical protein